MVTYVHEHYCFMKGDFTLYILDKVLQRFIITSCLWHRSKIYAE